VILKAARRHLESAAQSRAPQKEDTGPRATLAELKGDTGIPRSITHEITGDREAVLISARPGVGGKRAEADGIALLG
jgi:hypothetical protein